MSRWPQSEITRSGARRLRAYPVPQRHPVVGRAPEAEARAHDPVEVLPRITRDERFPRLDRALVLPRTGEERLGHLRVEPARIGNAPPAERQRAAEPRPGDPRA